MSQHNTCQSALLLQGVLISALTTHLISSIDLSGQD